jgi:hypothetical protein
MCSSIQMLRRRLMYPPIDHEVLVNQEGARLIRSEVTAETVMVGEGSNSLTSSKTYEPFDTSDWHRVSIGSDGLISLCSSDQLCLLHSQNMLLSAPKSHSGV